MNRLKMMIKVKALQKTAKIQTWKSIKIFLIKIIYKMKPFY